MLFPSIDRELLFTSIEADSPDKATAERAKARVEQVAKAVRERVRADGVQWATDRPIETAADLIPSTDIPTGYELPLAIGEDAMQALRDMSAMGVRLHNIGVSVEELCHNIATYSKTSGNGAVDVCVRVMPDKVNVRLRDDGAEFDPTDYIDNSGKRITGLELVRMLSSSINYNRVLGFNVTNVAVSY